MARTITPPTPFMSNALKTMTSHYGNPHKIAVEQRGQDWTVKCSWAERDTYAIVGSYEEALTVARTLQSDFMP